VQWAYVVASVLGGCISGHSACRYGARELPIEVELWFKSVDQRLAVTWSSCSYLVACRCGSVVHLINEVTLWRARLVL